MSHLDDALALAANGWPVFPCEKDKTPVGEIVERGHRDATTHARRIKTWWTVRPDALVGVALPVGTVAVDVDDPALFSDAGLDLPDAPGQQTPRGGYHVFYATDGRTVRQTIKKIPGTDTRVGGKGYVVAWEPQGFGDATSLPAAPEWLYADEDEASRGSTGVATSDDELLVGSDGATHRDDLVTYLGRMRWAGATAKELLQVMLQAQEDGRIVDGDPSRPWTEKDFIQLAADFGGKPGPDKAPVFTVNKVKHEKPVILPVNRLSASTLLDTEYEPLSYLIEDIFPEGMGVIAGAPKVGKSWLALQAALSIATGESMLGLAVPEAHPVLYYALEDGPRRLRDRLQILMGGRELDLELLDVQFEAPAQGAGLEEQIAAWLDERRHLPPGVIIIDVLAKIRPASKGKGNAYDEDYTVMGPLQTVARTRPGTSLAVVTHDRKAGSEDFLTTVTGTRGIVGAADWVWVLKRDRLQPNGVLNITGRDIRNEQGLAVIFADGPWVVGSSAAALSTSKEQQQILESLLTEGDMATMEIMAFLWPEMFDADEDPATKSAETHQAIVNKQNETNKKMKILERNGAVVSVGHLPGTKANVWHAVTDDERRANAAAARAASRSAMPQTGLGARVRRVHLSRTDAGEDAPEHAVAGGSAVAPGSADGRDRATDPSTIGTMSTMRDPNMPIVPIVLGPLARRPRMRPRGRVGS